MGTTKNLQSEVELQMLVVRAFDGVRMKTFCELPEGLCNAAYKIELEDGRCVVLKIAPAKSENLMSYEINMMQAEVRAMELAREKTDILLPQVYFYDATKTLCDSEYFFMECLDGHSFWSRKSSMQKEEIEEIEYKIGKNIRVLHEVKGDRFGLLGGMETSQKELFLFFYQLVVGILHDGIKKNIDIGVDYEMVRTLLLRDKSYFDEVTEPVLVHWDAWEGNWFVKNNQISGLIDWERAMFSDPLMEDRFRSHCRSESFLKGYGVETFTMAEKVRMAWYDIYLYIIMMIEGAYREYEDDGQYQWVKKIFLPIMSKVTNNEIV